MIVVRCESHGWYSPVLSASQRRGEGVLLVREDPRGTTSRKADWKSALLNQ